jgi:SAM-dependent methyltransferase
MLKPEVADYDDFAWFYDRYWNHQFHGIAFPILERIWLPRLPAGARILDVCCGTGYLAGLLIARGFRVSGIDASAPMIAHARRNAPEGEFQVADARDFQVPGTFDAAVSTFDSLNHITSLQDLEAVFRNVAVAMAPGGWFAFDILLEEAYLTDWGEAFALVRDDHLLTITGATYDFRDRTASCTITMFRLIDGVWRRSDVVVRERCYKVDEIEGALKAAGFGEAESYEAGSLGMGGQLGQGRRFFLTRKCAG